MPVGPATKTLRRGRAGQPARTALLNLLTDPARLRDLLLHLLAVPLGPQRWPEAVPWPGGGTRPLLLCHLPSGCAPPWCLLDVVLRRHTTGCWARPWLEILRRTGRPGWLVLLTDREDVLRGTPTQPLRSRYGLWVSPRVLPLGHHLAQLLSPRAPRLAPLAVWAARRWPAAERAAVLARALHVSAALPPPERRRQVAALLGLFESESPPH